MNERVVQHLLDYEGWSIDITCMQHEPALNHYGGGQWVVLLLNQHGETVTVGIGLTFDFAIDDLAMQMETN